MASWFTSRAARWTARTVLYGAFLLALPLAFSQALLRTARQPSSPAPPPWTEVHPVADGLRLRAWMCAGAPERAVVVTAHGLGDSLESYRELGEVLRRRGHGVLLLDLRAHGGSEGRYTTLGGHEREDVRAAMRLLTDRGQGSHGFVLLGVSMGAVAVLRAAVGDPHVRAVIAEAPYDTYRDTVAHHAGLYYGIPAWLPLIPATIAVAEWRAGFAASEIDVTAAARDVRAPLLVIMDGADDRMPETVVRRVYDAHGGPKELWTAARATHSAGSSAAGYWPEVFRFLEAQGL